MATPTVLVVGGGIAGVAVGYHLARSARVVLAEQEASLAYHTTGRSAALFFENYGAGPIRPLTRGSRRFLEEPPSGLTDAPLLSPRGALTVADKARLHRLREVWEEGEVFGTVQEWWDRDETLRRLPVLRGQWVAAAVWEPGARDMDVAAIHQAFVRGMRLAGAEIRTSAPLVAAEPAGSRVSVTVGAETLQVDLVVNAAGAWGDVVAERCGVTPVGLQPLRRTAFMVPGRAEARGWPLVVDVDHLWYFKPDGEQFLCSPADETPCHPCDARPEEVDIALAIERINAATHLGIRSVGASWAGLRTFAPDRAMVIGPDPDHPWFVWLVGQGGTGIQTAPAAGRLAACLGLGEAPPADLLEEGLDLAALSPARFRSGTAVGRGVP